jgi:hypothetical protein
VGQHLKKRNALILLATMALSFSAPVSAQAKNISVSGFQRGALNSARPAVVHDLSELIVNANTYLYKDCNKVDWCWQPQGTYRNGSKTSTITYLEVVYGISVNGGKELLFANKMKVNLRPGKSVKMFSGKYNKSFVLSFFDPTASSIGPLLGSSYVDWTYDVRYLQFSDGKSVGKRINN